MKLSTNYSENLQPFITYLENLEQRPSVGELAAQMEGINITMDDIQEFALFSDSHYRRNVVFQNDTVQLLCLCWKSGQRSPIHDHAESICGVRIMQGIATETVFEQTPSGYIKAVSSHDYTDQVIASEDSDTHQVSNLQEEGNNLVTLHCYSPPLNKMKLFTIDSRRMQTYQPVNEMHFGGSGI